MSFEQASPSRTELACVYMCCRVRRDLFAVFCRCYKQNVSKYMTHLNTLDSFSDTFELVGQVT